jgi:hypothetical protein
LIALTTLACAGCASGRITRTTRAQILQLRCGMTMGEVEKIFGEQVYEDYANFATFIVESGDTHIILEFYDQKLRTLRTATLYLLMAMKVTRKVDLCEETDVSRRFEVYDPRQ